MKFITTFVKQVGELRSNRVFWRVLGCAAVVLVVWNLLPPRFRFDKAVIQNPDVCAGIVATADEIILSQGVLGTSHSELAEAMDSWTRASTNTGAKDWLQLTRTISLAKAKREPENAKKLSVLNALALDLRTDTKLLALEDLVKLPPTESTPLILKSIKKMEGDRVGAAVSDFVDDPATLSVLTTAGWSLPPAANSRSLHAAMRWLFCFRSNRELWIEQFLTATTPLREELVWRELVNSLKDLPISSEVGNRFVVRSDLARGKTQFDPGKRLAWVAVELRHELQSSEGQTNNGQRVMETGIRLLGVPVEQGAANLEVHAEDAAVIVIALEPFNLYLHQLSLAKKLTATALQPVKVSGGQDEYKLQVTLRHLQFPSFKFNAELPLNLLSATEFVASVKRLNRECLEEFDNYLATIDDIDGWVAKLTRTEASQSSSDEYASFQGKLMFGKEQSLSIRAKRLPDASLACSADDTGFEGNSLAALLVARVEKLKDFAPLLKIEGWRFTTDHDRARLVGKFAVRTPIAVGAPVGASVSGRWEVSRLGNAIAKFEDNSPAFPTRNFTSTATTLSDAKLKKVRIQSAIQAARIKIYAALQTCLEFDELAVLEDKILLSAHLRIGDWPPLSLGPIEIENEIAAESVLKELLSEEHVKSVAERTWSEETPHVRRGSIDTTLVSWNPTTGHAKLNCRLPIYQDRIMPGRSVVANWDETIRTDDASTWETDDEFVQDQLDQWIDTLSAQMSSIAKSQLGVDAKLTVNPTGFGSGRWLRMRPPAISIQGSLSFPQMPITFGISDLTLQQKGIVFSDANFELGKRGTLAIPFPAVPFSVSDPRILFNPTRNYLGFGAVFTPPALPIGSLVPTDVGADGLQEALDSSEGAAKDAISQAGLSSIPGKSWRLDNLWLNVLGLDTQLGYAANNSKLSGETNLSLIGEPRLAQGSLALGFQKRDLEGQISAKSKRLGPLTPRLDGNVAVNKGGNGGFELGANMRIAGVDLRGNVDHCSKEAAEDPKRPVRIAAKAKLPIFDEVNVRGDSDSMFRSPRVSFRKKVPVDNVKVDHSVVLSKDGCEVVSTWANEKGEPFSRKWEGPRFDEASANRWLTQITKDIRASMAYGTTLSPNEEGGLGHFPGNRQFVSASTQKEDASKKDSVKEDETGDGLKELLGTMIPGFLNGQIVIDLKNAEQVETLVSVYPSQIDLDVTSQASLNSVSFRAWRLPDDSVLLFSLSMSQQKAVCHRIEGKQQVVPLPSSLAGWEQFRNSFPGGLVSSDVVTSALNQEVASQWISLAMAEYEPEVVFLEKKCCTLTWTFESDSQMVPRRRIIVPPTLNSGTRRPYIITLYNWLVPESDWNTYTDHLVRCSGSLSLFNRRATLAALVSQDDNQRMTFVVEDRLADQSLKQSGMSLDRFESWRVEQKVFRTDGSSNGERTCSLPVGILRDGKFRDHVSLMASMPWIDLLPDSRDAANAGEVSADSSSMASGVASVNDRIPVTARVGCDAVVILRQEGTEDWVMTVSHPADDGLKTYDLTRERFVGIDEDKAAMLRDEWRDGHRRRLASSEEVALSLITPWTENRMHWPARPRELLRAD